MAYFIIGSILGVYVFYVFIGSLRFLFQHARDEARVQAEHESQGGQSWAAQLVIGEVGNVIALFKYASAMNNEGWPPKILA